MDGAPQLTWNDIVGRVDGDRVLDGTPTKTAVGPDELSDGEGKISPVSFRLDADTLCYDKHGEMVRDKAYSDFIGSFDTAEEAQSFVKGLLDKRAPERCTWGKSDYPSIPR